MPQAIVLEAVGYYHRLPTAIIHLPNSVLIQDLKGRHVKYVSAEGEKLNGTSLEDDSDAEKALTDVAKLIVTFNNADARLRELYEKNEKENRGFFRLDELRVNKPELRGEVDAVDSSEDRLFLAAYLLDHVLAGELTYEQFEVLVRCARLRGTQPDEELNDRDRFIDDKPVRR